MRRRLRGRYPTGRNPVWAAEEALNQFAVTGAPDGYASTDQNGLAESGVTDRVGMSYNGLLISTGTKLVQIDTRAGGKLESDPAIQGMGHLMANLRAARYQPEKVDEIYITHLGPNHVGGIARDTERTFPNAMLRAPSGAVDLFRHLDAAPA